MVTPIKVIFNEFYPTGDKIAIFGVLIVTLCVAGSKMIWTKPTRSIEVNTDQSRIHTVDKGTKTEPLIILTPDELVTFSDGITIASFTNNIRIFVDTVNSTIVMLRPNTPPEPETQIGLLKIQPSASKGI